jgi:hypothetical protein
MKFKEYSHAVLVAGVARIQISSVIVLVDGIDKPVKHKA